MRALLIDSRNREIREAEYTDVEGLRDLASGPLDAAYVWDNGDALYIVNEGLLRPDCGFFWIDVRPDQPLGGNAVVVGSEEEFDDGAYTTHPPTLTLHELRGMVRFVTRAEVGGLSERGRE